jgi:hypothetical protein
MNYESRIAKLEAALPREARWPVIGVVFDRDDDGRFSNAKLLDFGETITRQASESATEFRDRVMAARPPETDWVHHIIVRAENGALVSGDEQWG